MQAERAGWGSWPHALGIFVLAMLILLPLMQQLQQSSCASQRSVVWSGLTNPRGLALGPDDNLYIAEVGATKDGGRVSRLRADGVHEIVASGLPYFVHGGTEEVGTAGVVFRDRELYIVQGEGAGDLASALLRLHPDRDAVDKVADLYFFEGRYNPDGGERESNPFSAVYDAGTDVFYLTDGAANDLLRVHPTGDVEVVAVWQDNRVPTGLARGPDGALYVSLFSPFPYDPNSGRIDRVTPDGAVQTAVANLTTPIGVSFDPNGTMYVLEFSAGFQLRPTLGFLPDSGRLLRVAEGSREVIADRLSFPTGVLARNDGSFLVSVHGAFSKAGSGAVLRIVPCRSH